MAFDKPFEVGAALVTPLELDSTLSAEGVRGIVEHACVPGLDCLIVNGSTGEGFLTGLDLRCEMVRITKDAAPRGVRVLSGLYGSSPEDLGRDASRLEDAGAEGFLVPPPAYVRPSQGALLDFYRGVRARVEGTLGAYNIPHRTGIGLDAPTIVRMVSEGVVDWVKDSTGGLGTLLEGLRLDSEFAMRTYCGDDAYNVPMLALGAAGVVSVVANIAPAAICALCTGMRGGDLVAARRSDRVVQRVNEVILSVPNPSGTKAVCELMGLHVGLPLSPLSAPGVDFHEMAVGLVSELALGMRHQDRRTGA